MKKQLMLGAAMLVALGVSAQNPAETEIKETIVTEKVPSGSVFSGARDNWFVSAGAGPQVFFGDHDRQRKFGQRISPALDIAVGKWLTPVLGMRLMYSGLYSKGATQNGAFQSGGPISGKPWHGYWLNKSKMDFMNLHVDLMFDVLNIRTYDPNRFYSLVPYAGVGYAHTWNRPHNDGITGNIGILNIFRVSKAIDINLDVRAMAVDDGFDGADGNRVFDGLVAVTAGLTYRFAPRGFKTSRQVVTVYQYDNDAVNALRNQVQQLVAENERLEREIANGKKVQRNVVEVVGADYLIYFPINVSELSKADRSQLEMCSKAILESDKDIKYTIIGYADKATGNPEINEILSRERAESVRDCLVNEFGVPASRLNVSWKGGVGNMFYNDPALSRVAIITPDTK